MKTLVGIFLVALSCSATAMRVTRQAGDCSIGDHVGKRCVEQSLCKLEDDTSPFTRSNLDALCVFDDEICCPNEKIKLDPVQSFDCSKSEEEGYGCFVSTECEEGTIKTHGHCARRRSAVSADTCCIKKAPTAPKCSDFEGQNFACVPEDKCNPQFKPLNGLTKVKNVLPPEPAAEIWKQTKEATCDDGETCCHSSWVEQPRCKTYKDDGFSCAKDGHCLDYLFPDLEDAIGRRGKCGSARRKRVCCINKKPVEEVKEGTCGDHAGYKCEPIPNCKLDQPVLKNAASDLIKFISYDKHELDNTISMCDEDDRICCKPKITVTEPDPPPVDPKPTPFVSKCGTHNPTGLGTEAKVPQDGEKSTSFGEWPFVCLLYQNDNLLGGASLIAPGVVLTAAHKIEDADYNDIRVVCGDWDIEKDGPELYPHQERSAASLSIHPQYNKKNFENNLALVHLSEDFVLDKHLDTICLGTEEFGREENHLQSGCVVMGWGSRAELDPSKKERGFQSILEAASNVPIVPNDQCETKVRSYPGYGTYKLHDTLLCAGGENDVDSCEGDGGGPLACPHPTEKDRFVLAGVTTAGLGPGCGVKNVPGAYASVDDNLCFIHWATKCKSGEAYKQNYWLPDCNSWLDDLKEELEASEDYIDEDYLYFAQELEKTCKPSLG